MSSASSGFRWCTSHKALAYSDVFWMAYSWQATKASNQRPVGTSCFNQVNLFVSLTQCKDQIIKPSNLLSLPWWQAFFGLLAWNQCCQVQGGSLVLGMKHLNLCQVQGGPWMGRPSNLGTVAMSGSRVGGGGGAQPMWTQTWNKTTNRIVLCWLTMTPLWKWWCSILEIYIDELTYISNCKVVMPAPWTSCLGSQKEFRHQTLCHIHMFVCYCIFVK